MANGDVLRRASGKSRRGPYPTDAAPAVAAAGPDTDEGRSEPKSNRPMAWWQWFVVYPTLLVSLMGLITNEKVQNLVENLLAGEGFSFSSDASDLVYYRRSGQCALGQTTANGGVAALRIDDTWQVITSACQQTGDLLLQIRDGRFQNNYSQTHVAHIWIGREQMIARARRFAGGQTASWSLPFQRAALAALPDRSAAPDQAAGTNGRLESRPVAQMFITGILCARQINATTFARKVQWNTGQCFMEFYNTSNGMLVGARPTDCSPAC